MNVLEKLEWLKDTLDGLNSESEITKTASEQVLKHFAVDIATALLEVAYTGDPVVQEVQSRLVERSKQGMKTYGISMDDNDLPPQEWINHAVEEALDFANYLTKLKRVLNEENS